MMTSPVDESHAYLGRTKQICVINQLQPWEIYPL